MSTVSFLFTGKISAKKLKMRKSDLSGKLVSHKAKTIKKTFIFPFKLLTFQFNMPRWKWNSLAGKRPGVGYILKLIDWLIDCFSLSPANHNYIKEKKGEKKKKKRRILREQCSHKWLMFTHKRQNSHLHTAQMLESWVYKSSNAAK